MALIADRNTILWVGGIPLSHEGVGLRANDLTVEAGLVDATELTDEFTNQVAVRSMVDLSIRGMMTDTSTGLRRLVSASAPAQPWPVIRSTANRTVGCLAQIIIAAQREGDAHEFPPGDLISFSETFKLARNGQHYDRAMLLVNDATISGSAPAPQTTTYYLDLGAAHSTGLVFAFMVDALTGSPTNITVSLQHKAARTASGWTTLTGTSKAVTSAPHAEVVTVSGTIQRYVAFRHAFTGGTTPSAQVLAAVALT